MKEKRILLLIILLTGMILPEIKAQSLIIQMKTGNEHIAALDTVQKLSFLSDDLIVSFNTGSSDGYALTEIRKLYFQTPVAIGENSLENSGLLIYPNPAGEYITVQGIPDNAGKILIYRTDGKVVCTEIVTSGNARINISQLNPGLYLIYISGRISKFIKQ